jgi:hypothetical protein
MDCFRTAYSSFLHLMSSTFCLIMGWTATMCIRYSLLFPWLGCIFLQESSGFQCFLFLWRFFHRNHDYCSTITFSERHQETCLYWAYVETYVGYQFVRQKQRVRYNSMVYSTMVSVHHYRCAAPTIAAPPLLSRHHHCHPHCCTAIAIAVAAPPKPLLNRHCRCCAA